MSRRCGPKAVGKLVLIAPFGVFDEAEPIADIFAQRPSDRSPLLSNRPDELDAYTAAASGDADETLEWDLATQRANNAAARLLWPLGDTRLATRLGRIACPTLLLRGADDRVMPRSYAARMAEAISGPTTIREISRRRPHGRVRPPRRGGGRHRGIPRRGLKAPRDRSISAFRRSPRSSPREPPHRPCPHGPDRRTRRSPPLHRRRSG